MAKILKKRNWAFVVYPESAPSDWIEQLQQRGVVGAISPLHDRDLLPTGEPKKAHWHAIVTYEGPTAQSVVERLTELCRAPKPIPLEGVRGYYRYLTHKENPEKFQYDEKDIQTLNGFSIRDFVEMTSMRFRFISPISFARFNHSLINSTALSPVINFPLSIFFVTLAFPDVFLRHSFLRLEDNTYRLNSML